MLELIKKALKDAGLDEGLAEKINVKTEAEITEAVKKLQKEEEIKKALKEKGLDEDFDKMLQSKIDSAISKAINAHDAKKKTDADNEAAKKAAEDEAAKKAAEEEARKTMTDDQKRIADLLKAVESLTAKVADLETKTVTQTRLEKVKAALAVKKLPEDLAKHITAETDEDIEAQITGLETVINNARQSAIDEQLKNLGGDPLLGGNPATSAKDETIKYAQEKNKVSAETGGRAAKQVMETTQTISHGDKI